MRLAPVPEKRDIFELDHNGRTLKGIIREPSAGTAIGVIHLTNRAGIRAVKTSTLARRSLTGDAVEGVFKAAATKVPVSVAAYDEQEGGKKMALSKRKSQLPKAKDSGTDLGFPNR